MRSLSESIRAILDRLRKSGTWDGTRQDEQDAQAIARIGRAREPAAVPGLIFFLYSRNSRIAEAAARAIQQIIDECNPAELAELEGLVRGTYGWHRIKPADVAPLSLDLPGILGVLSFDGSGYVRETAVRMLAGTQDGKELPFLLIRSNDWVEPVRNLAKDAVMRRIRPDYVPHFIRSLPLVYRLQGQHREDHRQVVEAILGLFRSGEARTALRVGLSDPDRLTRRLTFRTLTETPGDDVLQVLDEALASSDMSIRLWAGRDLRKRLEGHALQEVLERLNRDRFMPVRLEALYGFAEKLPELARDHLRAALLDPHRSMREVARFYLGKRGETEFASFYREALDKSEGGELATVIAGLGETGNAQDAQRLGAFVPHPKVRIRRATVRAIGHLDAEGSAEQLLTALQDNSPSVAKAARDGLQPHRQLLSARRLQTIFQDARSSHSRRIVFSLLAMCGWWEIAPLLILAAGSPDQEIAEHARVYLGAYRNPAILSIWPKREQIEAIEDALAKNEGLLDQATRKDLTSLLSYAKRERS